MGGVRLNLNLLNRFCRELKDPPTMLFVAGNIAPCLDMLSMTCVDGVIVCFCIVLENCRQCGGEASTCAFADPSILTEGGPGYRILHPKLMSSGVPGLSCGMTAVIIPRLLAK